MDEEPIEAKLVPVEVPVISVPVHCCEVVDFEEVESSLHGAALVVRDLLTKQMNEDTRAADRGELVITQTDKDPILGVLDQLVETLKHGGHVAIDRDKITQLISNLEDRAELINSLMTAHNFDRLSRYAQTRDILEKYLLRSATEGKLTPTEAMAVLSMTMGETEKLETKVRNGATSIKDVNSLMNKVDMMLQAQQAGLSSKFSDTSYEGREVVRRIAHGLLKAVEDDKK